MKNTPKTSFLATAVILFCSHGCAVPDGPSPGPGGGTRHVASLQLGHGAYVGLAGKCLNVQGGGSDDGTPIILWDCVGLDNEEWTQPDDQGQIRGLGDKCLAVQDGVSDSGTPIVLTSCDGSDGQQWYIQGQQVVGLAGKCLNVSGADSSNGAQVILWDCTDTDNASWSYRADTTLTIQPVFVTDDDGGRGPDPDFDFAFVAGQVENANKVYAAAHIQLSAAAPINLASTAINNMTTGEEAGQALNYAARYPNQIVVFYHWGNDPRTRTYGGFSSPPWSGLDFVAMPSTKGSTADLAHETGHYLGLDHTFAMTDNNPAKLMTREQDALRANHDVNVLDGDGLSDTPPDPGPEWWTAGGVSICDPAQPTIQISGLDFTPDRNNAMSYFGCKPMHFSPMQRARQRLALAHPLRQFLGADVYLPGPQRIFGQFGKCLRPDADPNNAGFLVLSTCTGDQAEFWTFSPSGQLVLGDQCLHQGTNADAARPYLADCSGGPDEIWSRESDGYLRSGNGRCLNVSGDRTDDGAPVIVWPCTPNARNDKWFSFFPVTPAPSGAPNWN